MNRTLLTLILLSALFSSAIASINNLVISEVCINNDTTLQNELGDFEDWFELYNPGTTTINLKDLYLSDDKTQLLKYQITQTDLNIEPGEFLVMWADGEITLGSNHVDFKLSKGERLTLFSLSSGIVDTVTLVNDALDVSYGREVLTHNNTWYYYDNPTPGEANGNGYLGFASDVVFSLIGGFYSSDQNVTLSANLGETIFYTLNNDDPDSSGILYNGESLLLSSSSIIRARTYREGYFPGSIVSHHFIINETSALPVWSVITDPDNLNGDKGIYNHPWSEGIAWERFAQHQYFIDNQLVYEGNSGIRIQGGNSVGMPKKSFRLHYRENYGDNRLEYPIFEHSGVEAFKQIVLKSGYDDDLTVSNGNLLRDPYSMEMWRLTGNLGSASEWATLMLNNQYWGIYNLRESIDDEFIEDHIGTNNFDMIRYQKTGPDLKHGTMAQWDSLTTFFNTTDFTRDAAFDEAAGLIDMDNFLNLLAFVHATQYRSWTWGASAYKGYKKDDRWRWTIWDTDRSFLLLSWNGFTEYAYTSAEKWGNFMPKKLLKNKPFKHALINRTADFLNHWFKPDLGITVLDSIKAIIAPEIANEQARWNSRYNWENNVESMRQFLRARPAKVRSQILSYFGIANTVPVNINISGKGSVQVNSLALTEFPWQGLYFNGVPISLTATPAKGYKFEKWSFGSTDYTIPSYSPEPMDTAVIAYFVPDTTAVAEALVINEIMYHESIDKPSGDWLEIYNIGASVDISGWWFTDENSSNKFTFPVGTVIDSAEYLIVAQSLVEFSSVNDTTGLTIIGGFGDGLNGFGLGNGGDCVLLYNPSGELTDSVCYSDKLPWPVLADGYGYSMQLLNAEDDNAVASNWDIYREVQFTPGAPNFINPLSVSASAMPEVVIYPNPVRDFIEIYLPKQAGNRCIISLYSITGQKLLQKSVNRDNTAETISWDLSSISQGSYILKIASQQHIWTKKLIKQ